MRYTLASVGMAALAAAGPLPGAVTSAISPSSTAPAGCSDTYPGNFEVTLVNVTTASKVKRQDQVLTLTLENGVLTDSEGATGYIASNDQFQFDKPPQAGAIYTSGWSVCSNGSMALGGSTVFYQCLSGSFYNIYDVSQGGQCSPVTIDVLGGTTGTTTGAVSEQPDGQPTGTPVPVTMISDGQPQGATGLPVTVISDGQPQGATGVPVTQISDGQPQGATGVPVTQISDGQPQGATGVPVTQISDGQPQGATGVPVTQISDGQPQGATGVPVTQISDGQPQGATGVPVTQISDGQPQGATGVPVTQISDGQPQATTGAPVTQISDGQIQATTGAPVTQITDGQPQAPTSTPAYVAGAGKLEGGLFGLAAAVLAAAAL